MKPAERIAQWYRRLVASRANDRPKDFPTNGARMDTAAYVRAFCKMNGLKR